MHIWLQSDTFWQLMPQMAYQIHSEARGPHWIAWISRDGSGKPDRNVVLVGATREEAEANARAWGERT
jgi:hypothetical protein